MCPSGKERNNVDTDTTPPTTYDTSWFIPDPPSGANTIFEKIYGDVNSCKMCIAGKYSVAHFDSAPTHLGTTGCVWCPEGKYSAQGQSVHPSRISRLELVEHTDTVSLQYRCSARQPRTVVREVRVSTMTLFCLVRGSLFVCLFSFASLSKMITYQT